MFILALQEYNFTNKQTEFCKAVALQGLSYKNAYLQSYDGVSEKSAYTEGNRLAEREDIQAYINHLKKPLLEAEYEQAKADYKWKLSLLREDILYTHEHKDYPNMARLLDIFNKMQGHYKSDENPLKSDENAVSKLTTEDLKKILN